ncbi:MAG TPA: pentapeptide repeat-containing protein [Ktedonobacteraceae bacterium]|nr:pentapeptide repeat-containing protein [Ktedonobacteraceae bacterium]
MDLYWERMGQPWRTEPEIDTERQEYLARRRAIPPDIKQGIYPFKDIKLSRADIEWLLATHDNGRGPVDQYDESQRERRGLDLRSADLRQVNLSGLPLAHMRGGLNFDDRTQFPGLAEHEMASVHLEGATLSRAHLEQADLYKAHLEGANLYRTHLEEAYLKEARLEQSSLIRAQLKGTWLIRTHLEGANLKEAHLEGSSLREARLEGAVLREAFFDTSTNLRNITLGNEKFGFALLADVRWSGVNLAVVNWLQVKILGDDLIARHRKTSQGEKKEKAIRIEEYQAAARANRQLAAALRDQGMHEEANHFAYHAHILYRKVLWWERKPLSFFFAWFLYLLAGYGYRPERSVIAYLFVVGVFAFAYFGLSMALAGTHHLAWYEALVVSLTAFHGRGFFTEQFKPGDPQAIVAAVEAVVGLLIEISFIATFTQRFLGK